MWITCNSGVVGLAVARLLRERHPDATIDWLDTGFFRDCLTPEDASPEQYLDHQHFVDIRSIDPGLLRNRDAVIHLAAISNDPMGNRFEKVTKAINLDSSIRLGQLAAEAGVRISSLHPVAAFMALPRAARVRSMIP